MSSRRQVSTIAEARAPPLLRIEDRGLKWRLDGEHLTLERRPTLSNVVLPLAAVAFLWILGLAILVNGGPLETSLLFIAGAVLALIPLGVRLRLRLELLAGPDGVQWSGVGAHRNEGNWPKGSISGVRVVRGKKPARWGAHEVVNTELRMGGHWIAISWGFDYGRSVELGDALKTALALPELT